MRHLTSLIAGIVIGVVAWAVIGFAQAKLGAVAVDGINRHAWGHYQGPLLLMAIAGVLIGLIASTRVSPIGPFVAGAGYVLLQLAYVTWPHFLNWLPSSVFGQHQIWTKPASSGVAALLGLIMLVAVLSVRRWQRWPDTRRAAADEPVVADDRAVGTGATVDPDRDVVERRRFPIGSRRRRAVPADEGAAPVEETRPEMDADPVHRQPSDT
jgi:hypothetical protein